VLERTEVAALSCQIFYLDIVGAHVFELVNGVQGLVGKWEGEVGQGLKQTITFSVCHEANANLIL